MTKEDFIKKWNVAFEDKEQELEFANEMMNDLNDLVPDRESLRLIKREYFAAMAMQGIIANRDSEKLGSEMVAIKSIDYADELLKQLELKTG